MNYVVLAGGTGTRLWPMSRDTRPKQFSQIISNLTMLEETLNRLEIEDDKSNLYISSGPRFAELLRQTLSDVPDDHIFIDPEKRDTGPAMALIAALLFEKAPDEPMAFIPSDAYIRDVKLFQKTLRAAEVAIRETGKMVNIGIVPTFSNVNLGYVKIGKLRQLAGQDDIHFYEFTEFVEKPAHDLAKKYLESGEYLWNANFYMWTPRKFLEVYKQYAPLIGNRVQEVAATFQKGETAKTLALYRELPKISIDYAVSEKMDPNLMIVIKGEFGWSDIGSWEQLYEQLIDHTDEQGNLIKGDWLGIDTASSLVYGQPNKIIATIGISDLVIVDTPDALLICPKGRAQDVKKIVTTLTENNQKEYL
jgi:mannose-1-phosphate guanylyltransferase